jgi:zinc protease
MEDIASASLDDCADFFSTHYAPNNAVLTLCGDIDPNNALDRAEHFFGEIRPSLRPGQTPEPETFPAATLGPQREVLEDDVELERIYLAFRAPGFGSARWYSADLLVSALAGGRSSPLYVDLVQERQLAQSLSMTVLPTELEATVAIIATVRPESSAEQLEEAIWGHLEACRRQPLGHAELDRSRNGAISGYFHGMESLERRADLISQLAVFTGDPRRAASDLEHYTEATTEGLRQTAERVFDRSASATVIVTPRGAQS